MTTNPSPLAWLDDALADLDRAGLRRHLAVRTTAQSAHVALDGRTLVNFGSNDYLGLAADPRLAAAAHHAAARHGWASGASPLVSGRSAVHAELERRLAQFEAAEAALLFPSGFAAGAGTIPALVDRPDAIFADERNHASLIDGCRLSRAKRFIYPHADCDALEALLKQSQQFRRRLIVTDALFSMDGDLAPLVRLAELADEYHAMLLTDEAHATAVFGPTGRGVAEHAGSVPFFAADLSTSNTLAAKKGTDPLNVSTSHHPPSNIHHPPSTTPAPRSPLPAPCSLIRIATLSKALASAGGFVCGSQKLIDYLANTARSYIFSTAAPPAAAAAALAALDIVRDEPHRRRDLLSRAATLRARLRDQGWNTGPSASHIIPLIIGDPTETMRLAAALRDAGYYLPPIRPPSVPEGQSLLRLSLCHHHTDETLDPLLQTLATLR